MKHVLITGVSTGIGYHTLKEFIARGYHVFGSVRNQKDADRLQLEFKTSYTPLVFDVTDREAIRQAVKKVSEQLTTKSLYCLVNNSGIAIGGPLQYQELEEIEHHFQVNVIGLMSVTKAFLPLLGAQENHPSSPGKIINISSVAGKVATPFVGAYVGSKHAVEGLSHSLRRELLIYGIDVIIVGPGAVKTPIWEKGMNLEKYLDTPYGRILGRFAKMAKKGAEKGLDPDFIAKQIVDISEASKPKVRYTYVLNKLTNWFIPRIVPARMMDRLMKNRLMK